MENNPFHSSHFKSIFELCDENRKTKNLNKFKGAKQNVLSMREILAQIDDREEIENTKLENNNVAIVLGKTEGKFVDHETRHQFVNARKEIFLIEYSISIQSAELARLEELIILEQKKLDLAEQSLEQDAALFDEFLKENDKNSVETVANAEQETRRRTAMGDNIKQLTIQSLQINAEINRLKEIIKDYQCFRSFLEKIMPQSKQSERINKRREQEKVRKNQKLEVQQGLLPKSSSLASLSTEQSFRRPSFLISRRTSVKTSTTPRQPNNTLKEQNLIMEDSSSSEESDQDVYFNDPHQVLSMLRNLEELNLSLIQHCQESEESIDLLKNQMNLATNKYQNDINILSRLCEYIQTSLDMEVTKSYQFNIDVSHFLFADYDVERQKEILNDLNNVITDVYHECIQKTDASLSSMQMLSEIEARLIDLLDTVQTLPEELFKVVKQAKEAEHRQQIRNYKKIQLRLHQEERIRKALERARAEPRRQTGRKLVTRSKPPIIQKQYNDGMNKTVKEQEELAYLFEQ